MKAVAANDSLGWCTTKDPFWAGLNDASRGTIANDGKHVIAVTILADHAKACHTPVFLCDNGVGMK